MAYLRHSYTPLSKFEINPQKSSVNTPCITPFIKTFLQSLIYCCKSILKCIHVYCFSIYMLILHFGEYLLLKYIFYPIFKIIEKNTYSHLNHCVIINNTMISMKH